MHFRKTLASIVLTGAALVAVTGTSWAAAEPVKAQDYWYVAASYPNNDQGRYACSNAVSNFPPGHAQCLVDSENSAWINLWIKR